MPEPKARAVRKLHPVNARQYKSRARLTPKD